MSDAIYVQSTLITTAHTLYCNIYQTQRHKQMSICNSCKLFYILIKLCKVFCFLHLSACCHPLSSLCAKVLVLCVNERSGNNNNSIASFGVNAIMVGPHIRAQAHVHVHVLAHTWVHYYYIIYAHLLDFTHVCLNRLFGTFSMVCAGISLVNNINVYSLSFAQCSRRIGIGDGVNVGVCWRCCWRSCCCCLGKSGECATYLLVSRI